MSTNIENKNPARGQNGPVRETEAILMSAWGWKANSGKRSGVLQALPHAAKKRISKGRDCSARVSFRVNFFFCQRQQDRLVPEPFTHADWSNAVDADLYAELSATFPLDQFGRVLARDNQVHRLTSKQLLESASTSACWRDFIRHLVSQTFWQELVEMFGREIRSNHRHIEHQMQKPLEAWRATRRGNADGDIVLEALAVINTPVRTKPSHVKGPHIDTADKLWTGLLYMRAEDDDTDGGALHLHRPTRSLVFDRHQIPRSRTEVAKTIPYEANRFVGFVNAPRAIHSVGPRPMTPHVRRYVDLVAELPRGKVFDVPQMHPLRRLAYRVSGRREPAR